MVYTHSIIYKCRHHRERKKFFIERIYSLHDRYVLKNIVEKRYYQDDNSKLRIETVYHCINGCNSGKK